MKKLLLVLRLFLCFMMLAAGTAHAQETTAGISGIVSDKSGPVAGVTVTAVHLPTGTVYATSTRPDGRYNLPNVRVGGPYQVTASLIGYAAVKAAPFTTILGQNFKVNISMFEANRELKEIVVSGRQDKVINNSRTGAQDVISRNNIERLPTISRSLNDFTRLSPTANSSQNYGSNSIAGRSNLYNNSTVNGTSFNNSFGLSGAIGGQVGVQPISIDAIDQVQVSIAPFDVTQGSFTGAGINSITKSGTNDISGMVYGYEKNQGLIGKHAGPTTVVNQKFNYHLDGFSVGGAIIKNKLFFFLNAEQERNSAPGNNYIASKTGGPAFSPTGQSSVANADTLNKLASFLQSKYNYNPGAYQNYNYKTYANRITLRLDYNINKNNTINANFFYLKSYKDQQVSNSTNLNGANNRQAGLYTLPFSGNGYRINNNLASGIIELNSRINNESSNKLQVGYTALRDSRSFAAGGNFPLTTILYGASLASQLTAQGVTGLTASTSYTSFGSEPFTYNNLLNTDNFQLNDVYSLFKGNHEINLGTQNQLQSYKNGFSQFYNGEYLFPSLAAFYASANNTPGAASPSGYQLSYAGASNGAFPFARLKDYQFSVFAQDRWNISDKFKLTYGIRAEMYVIPSSSFSSNPNVPALALRNGIHITANQVPAQRIQLLPRAGFNYDVFGDHTLQLRGGAGLFAGPPPMVWLSNQASNNGVLFGKFTAQKNANGVLVTPSGTPVTYSGDRNAYRPAAGTGLPTSYEIDVTDKNFRFPQILRLDLAADYKFPLDIVGTIEGLYTKDLHAVYFQNLNLPTAGLTLPGADPRTRYQYATIYGTGANAQFNETTPPAATSPNLSSGVIYMTNTNKGYAYNVIVQAQRNVKGWYIMGAYTHGTSKGVGSDNNSTAYSSWSGRAATNDPNANELGYSAYYQPDRVIAATSYRKEYAEYFATSLGFTFEGANNGVASYTYNEPSSTAGGLNNDGVNNNDLIFIPRTAADINLVDLKDSKGNVTTTAGQEWTNLNAFIRQDKYLNSRRGKYAERNGAVGAWYNRLDMNFTQDFFLATHSGKRNTLRFTADIYNLTNLLDKNWGLYRGFNNTSPITLAGSTGRVDPTTHIYMVNQPAYTFTEPSGNTSYITSNGIGSRWQMQFGLKYIFN